jgi:hypothetical protein
MCTLMLGVGTLGPGTVVLGAVRDERPERPSDPPAVLLDAPRVAGGRDRVAGGTWLAVRERRAVVALLNRRPGEEDRARAWPASRGRLALAVAGTVPGAPGTGHGVPLDLPPGLARAALSLAWSAVAREEYAPFSLVFASPEATWMVARDPGGAPFAVAIGGGWHVLTHTRLDDTDEPRAAWLLADLAGFAPRNPEEAGLGMEGRTRLHAEGHPAVCLHEGVMVSVSAARVILTPGGARYAHAEGRPCENPFRDVSHLLAGDTASGAPSA